MEDDCKFYGILNEQLLPNSFINFIHVYDYYDNIHSLISSIIYLPFLDVRLAPFFLSSTLPIYGSF